MMNVLRPYAPLTNMTSYTDTWLAESSISKGTWIALLLCLYLTSAFISQRRQKRVKNAPVHGSRWWFEPALLTQTRFMENAMGIVTSGYNKVIVLLQTPPPELRRHLTNQNDANSSRIIHSSYAAAMSI